MGYLFGETFYIKGLELGAENPGTKLCWVPRRGGGGGARRDKIETGAIVFWLMWYFCRYLSVPRITAIRRLEGFSTQVDFNLI